MFDFGHRNFQQCQRGRKTRGQNTAFRRKNQEGIFFLKSHYFNFFYLIALRMHYLQSKIYFKVCNLRQNNEKVNHLTNLKTNLFKLNSKMNVLKFQVKAGKFQIDKATNKVKPDKSKGKIIVERNQEQQTHFRWINTDTKIQQFDMIVFQMDAKFEAVQGKNNTFVLKFQTDTDKHYFWLQEKIDAAEVVKNVNDIINYQAQQEPEPFVQQKPQKIQKMEPEIIQKPMNATQKPIFGDDFISRLTKNIQAAQKQPQETNITHLQKIFNYETIGKMLNELTEQQKMQLIQFLPQQQQKIEFLNSNIRSAQFLQATDALSEALNTETAIAIFAEMGLNQNYLQKHYGVHAFIKALIDWGKQLKK